MVAIRAAAFSAWRQAVRGSLCNPNSASCPSPYNWFGCPPEAMTALQARLRRDLANAQWLAERIRSTNGWRVLAPVQLQTLCVRYEPAGLAGELLDRYTQDWCDRINRSGAAYLTPAVLDGRWMVRVSVGAEQTERPHVEALWALMQREVQA